MEDNVWYKDGLRFKCSQCGDCCTGAPGYVWVNAAEIEKLAAQLDLSVEEFKQRYTRKIGIRYSLVEYSNGDCVFFDGESRKCQVYGARPRQCRTWPFWNSNLKSAASWDEAAESCPGCNKGDLVPLEKIQEQAARIRI